MPYINITITKEKEPITQEQKEKLISGTTALLSDVLNKDTSRTVVIINEIDTENYGFGGESIKNLREKSKLGK
ncbi:MAG: tautomerase family protein [Campylobacter sp.]